MSTLLSTDKIITQAKEKWALETTSITEAIETNFVPYILLKLEPEKDILICAVRMYIAKYIGNVMSTQPKSASEMVPTLKNSDEWLAYCQLVDKKYPTEWWIKTQAPLYAGKNFLKPWPALRDRNRFPLISSIATAISLGVVRNNSGTDYFTFLNPSQQKTSFIWYCEQVKSGRRDCNNIDSEMRNKFPTE